MKYKHVPLENIGINNKIEIHDTEKIEYYIDLIRNGKENELPKNISYIKQEGKYHFFRNILSDDELDTMIEFSKTESLKQISSTLLFLKY